MVLSHSSSPWLARSRTSKSQDSPDARGQFALRGLWSSVSGRYGFDELGAHPPVMVADPVPPIASTAAFCSRDTSISFQGQREADYDIATDLVSGPFVRRLGHRGGTPCCSCTHSAGLVGGFSWFSAVGPRRGRGLRRHAPDAAPVRRLTADRAGRLFRPSLAYGSRSGTSLEPFVPRCHRHRRGGASPASSPPPTPGSSGRWSCSTIADLEVRRHPPARPGRDDLRPGRAGRRRRAPSRRPQLTDVHLLDAEPRPTSSSTRFLNGWSRT